MTQTGQPGMTPSMRLVRTLASEGDRIFNMDRARALAPAAGLSDSYFRQAMSHLTKSGWLVRLHNGLYALSTSLPGVSDAHEFEIAMSLVPGSAISHWSAMHYHGLTDQPPRKVFVLATTKMSIPQIRGKDAPSCRCGYRIGRIDYQFVRMTPERFFGIQKFWVGQSRVSITDVERTLLDGLMMPQYCGDFAEVLNAFEIRRRRLDISRIIDYALRLDAATAKRLGWVLEHLGVGRAKLQPLAELPIRGYRVVDPTGPRRGPCNRRWMIQENLPGRIEP